MFGSITRRQMLRETAGAALATTLVPFRLNAQPESKVHEIKVISRQPDLYHGWPTLTRRRDGDLLLVYSGGREAHVCPFGRVELMRSSDEGETWSWPTVLMDSGIDDRDAGVLETARGSILVTSFTSLAYESILAQAEGAPNGTWTETRLQRWRSAHNRLPKDRRQAALGVWMVRSEDNGTTWSGRYDSLVNSPHGPIQLADGRLLYPGKDLWRRGNRVGVCESDDDGQTWRWLSEIPARGGDSVEKYHELHGVETADGRIIVQIRNHNAANDRETLQCESSDGGRTFSAPESIGVWGLPSHLLRLRDDRLLMTYGYRRSPYGTRARLSANHGRTWSGPIVVSGDGTSGDLGYPSTVALRDGSLLTVWYEKMEDTPSAVLRQARWSLVA